MSPEQARGEMLTAASDVYALGVLTYALLAGYPPYEIAGQTPARARQMICEVEPDVPSAIVSAGERRALAGTLDRIILKALRKNPRERYATAAELAADLRAWRDRRPASVAPATPWSRITGLRGGAAWFGAAAIGLALLAGAGALGRQAYLLQSELDRARADLVAAESQKGALEEQAARRPPVTDLRLQVAAITHELALAERRRGDLVKAEALGTQVLADVRPLLDASPPDLRALERVAAAHALLGSVCRSQRRFEESLAHYREALRARERAAAVPGVSPDASLALADARTGVAKLLLDLVEVRRADTNGAARLRDAGALLAQADPVIRRAASSPPQQDALAELDRQTQRLRRLKAPRQ
jgi:tetratricopeptide (TPR) repeat protein